MGKYIDIPKWTAGLANSSDPIAVFIHDNEPAGDDAVEFRQQFQAALNTAADHAVEWYAEVQRRIDIEAQG